MGAHEGAVAIVTGASRGIGLGIAERLVAEGAKVVITARRSEALAEAVEQLGGPGNAIGISGNAADEAHQEEVIAAARDTFGGLHLLVNNTGINPVYGPMLDTDGDVARKILDVNVVAAFSWIKKAVAAGLGDDAHPGAVVNLASVAGLGASGMIGWYGVSKAALIHLTTELGHQLGPDVRVNAVAPAVVKTKFAEALYVGREEQVAAAYPMKRLGTPEDIAGAVSFLLSSDASWITGQTLTIDGGVTLGGAL
ncbi:3-ketoacyl-ACP reductase [Intrasporangium oryzae NRRL B-24470]|uniref:3-ketoacyl-ACP reductase n=1 Tax=Intrasporangium oryzae NRRL B-24470 TaxID=1386089 RepID=W9G885_9MICO|nr:SDR family oxidoreductase [Intrasporangium oryzae]EWT00998.1 3-ketoacyl-ACP reductase [Intrasporangium oryzae NRRL B-24470]